MLNRNYQFQRVYRKGASFVDQAVVVYVLRNRSLGIRTGITASKKIGGAVERNRARRVVNAALSALSGELRGNFDIVVVCRAAVLRAKSTELAAPLRRCLRKAGVIEQ